MAVSVLVVDDTDHVRSMLAEMLRLDGFDVVGRAADGDEAVALAARLDPAVVVMDLRMPGVDGIEATRRIKAAGPDRVVILYTAYLDDELRALAREAGASACLGKVEGLGLLEREIERLTLDRDER